MDITKFAFALDTDDIDDANTASIFGLIVSIGIDFNIKAYDILYKYIERVYPPSRVWNSDKREFGYNSMFITTLNNINGPDAGKLWLGYNLISDITSFSLASKFPFVYDLDLSGNDIVSLTGVQWPSVLTHLYLDNNRIKNIDDVNWPPKLQYLFIQNNEISSLRNVILPRSLLVLNVSKNNITTINDFILPINLLYLNLDDNKLTSLANVRFLVPNLSNLSLAGNSIKSFSGTSLLSPSLTDLKLGFGTDISDLVIFNRGKYDRTGKDIITISGLDHVTGLETFLSNAKRLMIYLKDISITDQKMIVQLVLEGTPYIELLPTTTLNLAMREKLAQDLLLRKKEDYNGVLIIAYINLYHPIPKGPSDPPVIFDLIDIGQVYNLSDTDIINKVLETSRAKEISFADAIKVLRTNPRKCNYTKLTECSTFNIHVEEFDCCYTPDNDIILDYLPMVEKRITPEYTDISYISYRTDFTSASEDFIRGRGSVYFNALNLYTNHGDRILNGYYRSGSITPYIIKYVHNNINFFKKYIIGSDHITDQMIYDFIINYTMAMDKIFKNGPTVGPEGLTIYRGLTSNLPIARLPAGIVYLNKGILSASISRKVAINFTKLTKSNKVYGLLLEFYLPPGTKALYMESITKYPEEYEVILPNNSKFVVETNDVIMYDSVSINRTVHRLILD